MGYDRKSLRTENMNSWHQYSLLSYYYIHLDCNMQQWWWVTCFAATGQLRSRLLHLCEPAEDVITTPHLNRKKGRKWDFTAHNLPFRPVTCSTTCHICSHITVSIFFLCVFLACIIGVFVSNWWMSFSETTDAIAAGRRARSDISLRVGSSGQAERQSWQSEKHIASTQPATLTCSQTFTPLHLWASLVT